MKSGMDMFKSMTIVVLLAALLCMTKHRVRVPMECVTPQTKPKPAAMGVVQVNSYGNVVEWPNVMETITGRKHKDVVGKPIYMLVPRDRRDAEYSKIERAGEFIDRPIHLSCDILTEDGGSVPIFYKLVGSGQLAKAD